MKPNSNSLTIFFVTFFPTFLVSLIFFLERKFFRWKFQIDGVIIENCKLTASRFQNQCKYIHGCLRECFQYYCTFQSFVKHRGKIFVVRSLAFHSLHQIIRRKQAKEFFIFINGCRMYLSTNRGSKSCIANITIQSTYIAIHHCFLTFSRPKSDQIKTKYIWDKLKSRSSQIAWGIRIPQKQE